MPRPEHLCCKNCWFSFGREMDEYWECQICADEPMEDLPRVHKDNCTCFNWVCKVCYGEISMDNFHEKCLLLKKPKKEVLLGP